MKPPLLRCLREKIIPILGALTSKKTAGGWVIINILHIIMEEWIDAGSVSFP